MKFEWEETESGNWRLFDRSTRYITPIELAIAHRTAGEGDWFAGIVYVKRGRHRPYDRRHDIIFRAEHSLEEMKALIETTVALMSSGDEV